MLNPGQVEMLMKKGIATAVVAALDDHLDDDVVGESIEAVEAVLTEYITVDVQPSVEDAKWQRLLVAASMVVGDYGLNADGDVGDLARAVQEVSPVKKVDKKE